MQTPAPLAVTNRALRLAIATDGAYDLARIGEDRYRLDVPAVGFRESDLDVEARNRVLTVRGRVPAPVDGETLVHAGLARRGFERRFTLADHVEVVGARLARGLLSIELVRRVPEALRPRSIPVAA